MAIKHPNVKTFISQPFSLWFQTVTRLRCLELQVWVSSNVHPPPAVQLGLSQKMADTRKSVKIQSFTLW
jgi:hypothetical protein